MQGPAAAARTGAGDRNGSMGRLTSVHQDGPKGVVFILNVTGAKEAHGLLDKLPLGQVGLMEFQLIPIGPLSPIRTLLPQPSK